MCRRSSVLARRTKAETHASAMERVRLIGVMVTFGIDVKLGLI